MMTGMCTSYSGKSKRKCEFEHVELSDMKFTFSTVNLPKTVSKCKNIVSLKDHIFVVLHTILTCILLLLLFVIPEGQGYCCLYNNLSRSSSLECKV